jgi:hypothetical protein
MMLNFRLLAGLMSFEFILWLAHFCSSGPAGILLSGVMGVELIIEYWISLCFGGWF